MPETIPILPKAFFRNIAEMSQQEIAFVVCNTLLSPRLPAVEIKRMVADSLDIPIKVVPTTPPSSPSLPPEMFEMQLYHGPTGSSKDIAARFMARSLPLLCPGGQNSTIMLATSGDSGAALAAAFASQSKMRMIILFPHGQLSREQLAKFVGKANVTAIEVDGSIETCRELARKAAASPSVTALRPFTLADASHIAYKLPAIISLFYGYAQALAMNPAAKKCVFSIPEDSPSLITAAAMAAKMGLPLRIENEAFLSQPVTSEEAFIRIISEHPDKIFSTNQAEEKSYQSATFLKPTLKIPPTLNALAKVLRDLK